MKKLFYSLAVLAAVTACNKEIEQQPAPVVGEGIDFIATFEDADTRVYLGEDYFYRWEADDPVSVFTGSNHAQYKAATGDVVETTLEYVSTTAALGSALSENYALYPYDAAATINDGVISTTLPAEQTYDNAVPTGINNAIMVSQASGTEFVFKNSCALVKVNLKIAEDFVGLHSVKSIRVSSKKHPLSGSATINVAGGDYTAKVKATPKATEGAVTLIGCEAAGKLQNESAMTFYLAIPAGTYEAGDLTVSVLTSASSTPFNQSFTLKNNHTVNRSQYIEVTATIAKDYDWFEVTDDMLTIKENVTLTNKAIIAHVENLEKQGFHGQGTIETIFDVPSKGITIEGADLVELGYASPGEDGRPTVSFVSTSNNVFVMNTFTSYNSGWMNTDPDIVTVEDLRLTGEVRTNTLGIYVSNGMTTPTGAHQGAFHTVMNRVDVVDCRILPYSMSDAIQIGAAVCVYGEAYLTDCRIEGTALSEHALSDPMMASVPYYDMGLPNNSVLNLNKCIVGTIYGWEQASLHISNESSVDLIRWNTLGLTNLKNKNNDGNYLNYLYIDNSTVTRLELNGHSAQSKGSYPTKVTLTKTAHIKEMIISSYVATNFSRFVIEDGAQIDKLVVAGTEMTLADFVSTYNITTTL